MVVWGWNQEQEQQRRSNSAFFVLTEPERAKAKGSGDRCPTRAAEAETRRVPGRAAGLRLGKPRREMKGELG